MFVNLYSHHCATKHKHNTLTTFKTGEWIQMFSWSPCSICYNMFTLLLDSTSLMGKQAHPILFKGHFSLHTWFYTKLDPPSLHFLQWKKSNIARKLPHLFERFLHIFTEEKLSFPVFPRINDESIFKFIQTHSSPRKTRLSFSVNSMLAFIEFTCFTLRKCTLCGPLVFVPNIPSQWVLQCASWWLQD